MIKKLLMVFVLGTLLVGTISAGTMIADRAMAHDQTQREDGGIIKYVVTKLVESGFGMILNVMTPEETDKLVDIAMEKRPDIMVQVATRLETKAYANTITTLTKENPMFISDVISGLDAESLSKSVNVILTEKPVFIFDVVSGLDAKSSSKVVNTLLNENPAFVSEIIGEVNIEPLVEPMAALFENNPGLLADLMEQLDEDTLNAAINELLEENDIAAVVELPEQRIEVTVPLPPELAELFGQKKITLKPTVTVGSVDGRMTKIIIKKGGKK